MPGSPKHSLLFPLKSNLLASSVEQGQFHRGAAMGPGHIFQPFVNNSCRIKVLVMAVPFNRPPRVRESTWRQPFQSSTDLFYSVIYKPNKVEDRLLPTVQLTGKKHYAQVQYIHQGTKELLKASPLRSIPLSWVYNMLYSENPH